MADAGCFDACCLALSTICTGSDDAGLERKQIAVDEGVIELLIEPLRAKPDARSLERGCGLLRNLCVGQDADGLERKRRARDAGAMTVIESALSNNLGVKSLQGAGRGALRNIRGGASWSTAAVLRASPC